MLIPNLYQVNKTEKIDESNINVQIELNSNHEIFKGHFPGNPITPGVCMMQIIKELVEDFTNEKLILSKVSNVKFMAKINPFVQPILDLNLNISNEEGLIKVKNSSYFNETNALKFSASFRITA